MARRFTYEEVKNFIEVESGSGCKLLSKRYTRSKNKLQIQCRCGNIFNTTYHDFRHNMKRQCNKCSSKKFSYHYIKNYIENESKSGCVLKSFEEDYNDVYTKITLQCKCGMEFVTDFNQFKNQGKKQCNNCGWERSNEAKSYDFVDIKKYIDKQTNFTLLSKCYNDCKSKLKLICPGCNSLFYTTFDSIKNNKIQTCKKCAIKYINSLKRIGFIYIKDYIENNSSCTLLSNNPDMLATDKIQIQCNCGNIFETTYQNFKYKNKRQCNDCSSSIGERIIIDYFLLNNIEYATQYIFDDCFNILPLRFDFAIFVNSKKNKLIGLVEYDGRQHFEPIDYFGGQEQFECQQHNDQIKNQYCKDNNIPLLRIPYWEFDNIESILEEWLTERGVLNQ